jgi:phosphoenolpyruvate synthase/pyruvate phosphate dikinase
MVCNKSTGMTGMLSFASFSHALWPDTAGGLSRKIVDYSQIDLTRNAASREALGRLLADIGRSVEKALGQPQDIEGAVIGRKIYLLQSRAQQGLE